MWRSCRGWQLILYHGTKNQISQLKLAGLVSTSGGQVQEQAIALMKQLGVSYVGDKAIGDLFVERDRLLPEFKLSFAFGHVKHKHAATRANAAPDAKPAPDPVPAHVAKSTMQKGGTKNTQAGTAPTVATAEPAQPTHAKQATKSVDGIRRIAGTRRPQKQNLFIICMTYDGGRTTLRSPGNTSTQSLQKHTIKMNDALFKITQYDICNLVPSILLKFYFQLGSYYKAFKQRCTKLQDIA